MSFEPNAGPNGIGQVQPAGEPLDSIIGTSHIVNPKGRPAPAESPMPAIGPTNPPPADTAGCFTGQTQPQSPDPVGAGAFPPPGQVYPVNGHNISDHPQGNYFQVPSSAGSPPQTIPFNEPAEVPGAGQPINKTTGSAAGKGIAQETKSAQGQIPNSSCVFSNPA